MIDDIGFKYIYDNLTSSGFLAYAVGGAVRDEVRGERYSDVDVATSALPEIVMQIFANHKTVLTGLKHGTVGVVVNGKLYEVTTFRSDGNYSDGRHPDSVKFVSDLKSDLSRRDFTINALAYNEREGLIDYFGSVADIKNSLIRCVGTPEVRFKEDALRILRAIRFSSVLGFKIEEKTALAVQNCKELLCKVSGERIFSELKKTLLGDNVESVLFSFREVFAQIIPQLKEGFDFDQKNSYHCYSVYDHIVKSVAFAVKDFTVRLTMLFHDIGKPRCYTFGEDGRGHFYGHHLHSMEIAKEVLTKLKIDNSTKSDVLQLVRFHDFVIPETKKDVKKALSILGERLFLKLMEVQKADSLAHSDVVIEARLNHIKRIMEIFWQVKTGDECYSLKRLAVNGDDLIKMGYSGKEVGKKLKSILQDVICERVENDRQKILERLKNE